FGFRAGGPLASASEGKECDPLYSPLSRIQSISASLHWSARHFDWFADGLSRPSPIRTPHWIFFQHRTATYGFGRGSCFHQCGRASAKEGARGLGASGLPVSFACGTDCSEPRSE